MITAIDSLDLCRESASGPRAMQALSIHFFTLSSSFSLKDVLQKPASVFLEICNGQALEPIRAAMQSDAPDFALSLKTKNAYDGDLPALLAAHLHQRLGFCARNETQVTTCLQEALANAIIHGNLSLPTSMECLDDFHAYYRMIEQRLNEEPYQSRRIQVRAWDDASGLIISVSDEGDGFILPELSIPTGCKSGHGLFLIRSLTKTMRLGDEGRTLYMTFSN